MNDKEMAKLATGLMNSLANEGRVLEGGWQAMEMAMPPEAGKEQREALRYAFYAGAQHLFSALMTLFDEDNEPTEQDMRRITSIHAELEKWTQEQLQKRQLR